MARLTVTTDLSGTITRQTLYNIWGDAALAGKITDEELAGDAIGLQIVTAWSAAPSEPTPGKSIFLEREQLLYVWVDEFEGTGVSLWQCLGPDMKETFCLASEPIPAGAIVEPLYDRWVRTADPSNALIGGIMRSAPIGICQSGLPDTTFPTNIEGTTQDSGTWIRVAISGFVPAWFPKEDTNVSDTHFGTSTNVGGIIRSHWLGMLGGDRFKGGVGRPNLTNQICDNQIGSMLHHVTSPSGYSLAYARIHWQGFLTRTAT
jgi:hypothetical protein